MWGDLAVLWAVVSGGALPELGAGTLVVWTICLPRPLAALLVGAALGASGAVFQGITRNELASPYILGVSAGAGLAALLVMVFAAAACAGWWGDDGDGGRAYGGEGLPAAAVAGPRHRSPLGAGVGLELGLELDVDQRTGVVVGLVSALAFVAAAAASRRAHRVEEVVGDTDRAAKLIALANGVLGLGLGAALLIGWAWPAAVVFVALAVVINLLRPIDVGRFDRDGDEADAATVLSIESQAKALAAAILAPSLGAWIDHLAAGDLVSPQAPIPATDLWPVALVAALPLLLAVPVSRGTAGPQERGRDSRARRRG